MPALLHSKLHHKIRAFIRRTLESTWFLGLAVIAVFVWIALNGSGLYKYFTEGAVAIMTTGILVAAYYLILCRIVRFAAVSLSKGKANALFSENPNAWAMLASASLIGCAIVTHAVFT